MSLQAQLDAIPGVTADRDDATVGFVFNHTMLRVKDIARSLDFYTRVLGFTLVRRRDFDEAKFSLYFLVLVDDPSVIPDEEPARGEWLLSQRGVLELTHNHGTENDPAFSYHDGNSEPRGFGHICLSVPDVEAACARFEATGRAVPEAPHRRSHEEHRLHQGPGRLLGGNPAADGAGVNDVAA